MTKAQSHRQKTPSLIGLATSWVVCSRVSPRVMCYISVPFTSRKLFLLSFWWGYIGNNYFYTFILKSFLHKFTDSLISNNGMDPRYWASKNPCLNTEFGAVTNDINLINTVEKLTYTFYQNRV